MELVKQSLLKNWYFNVKKMLLSNWEIEHGYINFMKVKSHYISLFQTLSF